MPAAIENQPAQQRVGQLADQPHGQRGPPIEDAGRRVALGHKLLGGDLVVVLAGVDPFDLAHVEEHVARVGIFLADIAHRRRRGRFPKAQTDQQRHGDQHGPGLPGRKPGVTACGGGHEGSVCRGIMDGLGRLIGIEP